MRQLLSFKLSTEVDKTNKPVLQTTKKLKSSSLLSAPVRDARERAKRFKRTGYLEHLVREFTREIMANIYNK